MPAEELIRGLSTTIDFVNATLKSLIDGKDPGDVEVQQSALWAKAEIDRFLVNSQREEKEGPPMG